MEAHAPPREGSLRRALDSVGRYLHAHPIVALALLTPGIPEYLLGSSSIAYLVLAPPLFFLFLTVNLGIYTGCALLVREALVRWRKGWLAGVLLGAAFATVEEGLGAATFFDPHSAAVGALGSYGHFAGVNWVDVVGITGYHTVVSIGIPLLLFSLALPEWRGRPLLDGRRLLLAVLAVTAATSFLSLVIVRGAEGFVTPIALEAGYLGAIALLALAARRLPDALRPGRERPTGSPRALFGLGALFVPATLAAEFLPLFAGLPALGAIALQLAVGLALLLAVLQRIGRVANDRHRLALATGVCTGVAVLGALITLPLPSCLIAAALAAVGLGRLYRRRTDGAIAPLGSSSGGTGPAAPTGDAPAR